jgi:hypothetical protein
MAKTFYYDGLVMSHILSYIGTRKPIGERISVGIYTILNPNMSKWRTTQKLALGLVKFKITERIGNTVIISKLENEIWSMPTMQDVHTFNGIETIRFGYNKPAVWKWIQPKHKLECLFTKKEWLTFTLNEKIKRYCEAINEPVHQWWLNYVEN